jgi:tRNA pseudouridine55 synthase
MLTEKTYEATIRLGQSTSTDDAEGEPTGGSPATGVTRGALEAEIAKLTGEILQVPSSVSAIKVNGQRAYKLTRAGKAPQLAARPVTVYEFTVTAIRPAGDYLDVDATIRCSSGTYIRALARDLGTALGTGGHLTALRRTAVGPYTLAQAHTLKDLENQDQDQSSERVRLTLLPQPVSASPPATPTPGATPVPDMTPPPEAETGQVRVRAGKSEPKSAFGPPLAAPASGGPRVSDDGPGSSAAVVVPWVTPLAEAAAAAFPRLDLTANEARRLAQGARLPFPPNPQPPDPPLWPAALNRPDVPLAAFDPDGTLIALVTAEGGRLRSLAVFVDAAAQTRDT